MTAKKKTLTELMLDAGVKPESLIDETKFIVCDSNGDNKHFISEYNALPKFKEDTQEWCSNGFVSFNLDVKYACEKWESTIITKQQFIDAYNEKHSVGAKTNIAEDKQVEDIEPREVVVENNTNHAIHADLSDIDAEKFKREFNEAGKHIALTPTHYSIIGGKDLIARSADSYKTDEFRGAMRFNIEKYIDRLGKKDSLANELRKIADYANRWADYEEKLQGSK